MTITLDDLRRAADAVHRAVDLAKMAQGDLWWDVACARAEFWRLAFKWRDGPNGCGAALDDYEKGMKIIAEVEPRT